MRHLVACLALIFLALPKLSAAQSKFYLTPTPRGFNSSERFEVSSHRRYDSEVESDELAFLRIPCHFQNAIRMSSNFFCGSVGSIGSKRFLNDMDMVFGHTFNESTTVRYHGVKKQDFTTDTEAGRVELLHQVGSRHSIGIHGGLDSEKANNDAGASYNFHTEDFFARFEFNAYDFDRNKRNEDLDFFTQKPISLSASFLKAVGNDRYYLNLHLEPQFIWQTETENIRRLRHWVEGFVLNEFGYFALESRQGMTHINEAHLDEKMLRLHGEKTIGAVMFGSRAVRRSWKAIEGRLIQHDVVPFVWYRFKNYPKWDVGYDVTFHRSYGDEDMKTEGHHQTAFEHRMNVAWNIFENQTGFFRLLFTFDLDRFGTEETWEGGSGQLAFTF